jgi:predicted PurR-regulated permease PerM
MEFRKESIALLIGVLLTLVVSYFIVESFIIPIIFSFLLVYILYPLYSKVKKYTKTHTLTSLLIILFFLLMILIPIFMMFVQLSTEVLSLDSVEVEASLLKADTYFEEKFNLEVDFIGEYELFLTSFQVFITDIVLKIPHFLFQLFLIVFFYYYFSREYNFEILFLKKFFGELKFEVLSNRFKQLVDGIIYGQILVRFIQALVGLVGFFLLGLDNIFLWAFIMFFVSFLPLIGTGLVWLPLAIIEFLHQNYIIAILILVLGFFISAIDNILLPHLISGKTKIGPVIILISILGGIEFFGIYGLLLGPFVLGALIVFYEEIFFEYAKKNPRIRKFVWDEKERDRYRTIKSKRLREEYVLLVNKKYELNIKKSELNIT